METYRRPTPVELDLSSLIDIIEATDPDYRGGMPINPVVRLDLTTGEFSLESDLYQPSEGQIEIGPLDDVATFWMGGFDVGENAETICNSMDADWVDEYIVEPAYTEYEESL